MGYFCSLAQHTRLVFRFYSTNNRRIGRLGHAGGARIKSVNTGAMIGNRLNNPIFEFDYLAL